MKASKIPVLDRLWQGLSNLPAPVTEESIPLRILVQLLVFIGIAATDVAADTNNSIWGIPLSAIGASWGWYARRRQNILVKFAIAIAMIVMLVVFLGKVIGQQEDTKLLLAGLLIQLQVLHSFDLPRRKDLGYSIVIGLILLGVAGTLSQTTVFGLWLLLFLAIALPVLVLDYRSRLGLSTRSLSGLKFSQAAGMPPRSLLGFLALVLVMGLGIFALLPRLPGFQLRNFPVSANVNIQRQIPAGGIITRSRNPQTQGNQAGTGTNNADGTGNNPDGQPLLPPLFATEIDQTAGSLLNLQLKPELVMRVRSQAELFWRVMAYDEYTGKGWRVSRNDKSQIKTLKRSSYNYEFYVPPITGYIPEGAVTQDVIQTYTITTENFPNLVPAASVPYRLYFPSDEMDLDSEGSLRAPGPLPPDLTYTVISTVPIRDRTALGKTSQTYPKQISSIYLALPENLAPQVRIKALEIIGNARNTVGNKAIELDNPYEKALFLTQSLKQRFQIKNVPFDPSQGDISSQFVAHGGGDPSHFATTLTIMLRSLGIPARYAVGFAAGKFNAFTGFYEVQNTDARSMVEVFFPGYGWLPFDPMPGTDLYPTSVEVDQTFTVLRQFWNWVAGFLPSPVTGFLAIIFAAIAAFLGSTLGALFNWLLGLGFAGIFVAVIILFGLGLLGWGTWQVWLWWRARLNLQRLHPTARVYQQMQQWLAEQGMPKSPHQTPQEYATQVINKAPFSDAQQIAIAEITQAYQDWHYGDRSTPANILKALLQKLYAKKS